PGDDDLPPGGHLQDGQRRRSGGGRSPACARDRGFARYRCIGDAPDHLRQHQRAHLHDCRTRRRIRPLGRSMKNRLAFPLLLAVVLAGGAWFALRPPDLTNVPVTSPAVASVPKGSAPPDRLSASAVLSIDPRPNPLRPARPMRVKATLFNEYLEARNYRALYDRLHGTAEGQTAEGKLVLYEVMKACANVTEGKRYQWKPQTPKRDDFVQGIASTDPQKDRRIAAYDNFTANHCVGFD